MTSKKPDGLDVEGSVVALPDGDPAGGALVLAIWIDRQNRWYTQVTFGGGIADEYGSFAFQMPDPGVDCWDEDGSGTIILIATSGDDYFGRKAFQVQRGTPFRSGPIPVRRLSALTAPPITLPSPAPSDPGGLGGPGPALDEIAVAIGNLSGGGSIGRKDDLDGIFNDAVFRVLGQRVRLDQPRDLQMAFERVFVETEIDGRSEIEYRGTSGAVAVSGEPGNVSSGLQAVVYRKAQSDLVAIRQTLREMEAEDDDTQDLFMAQQDVVERKLVELVSALGQEVRPPIARVDAIFLQLLGRPLAREKSSLATLGRLVGFAESDVLLDELLGTSKGGSAGTGDDITRDDDLTSTRFIEVASYVTGVFTRWQVVRRQLTAAGGSVPLGTKLDVLGRLLDRVSEETGNLDAALTLNGIDAAQREFLEISAEPATSLAELMRWLREFSVEGKSYDSGPGAEVVQATAGSIHPLIADVLDGIEDFPELNKRAIVRALEQNSRVLEQIKTA